MTAYFGRGWRSPRSPLLFWTPACASPGWWRSPRSPLLFWTPACASPGWVALAALAAPFLDACLCIPGMGGVCRARRSFFGRLPVHSRAGVGFAAPYVPGATCCQKGRSGSSDLRLSLAGLASPSMPFCHHITSALHALFLRLRCHRGEKRPGSCLSLPRFLSLLHPVGLGATFSGLLDSTALSGLVGARRALRCGRGVLPKRPFRL